MLNEMKMLLWKDYRLSRICIMAGIIFIIVPYLFFFFPYIYWTYEGAWIASSMLSQLTMALLSGNIISCERVDRSADFLAFQGISRKMTIASKMIICTMVFASICAVSFVLGFWLKIRPEELPDFRIVSVFIFTTGFCFFGCGWLLSALLSSSVADIVFGLLPPMFIGCALGLTGRYLHWPSNDAFPYCYIAICIMVGLTSLVAGTWYFISSKES